MRPTGRQNDIVARHQLLEAGIAVDMEHTLEVLEVGNRTLGFSGISEITYRNLFLARHSSAPTGFS